MMRKRVNKRRIIDSNKVKLHYTMLNIKLLFSNVNLHKGKTLYMCLQL